MPQMIRRLKIEERRKGSRVDRDIVQDAFERRCFLAEMPVKLGKAVLLSNEMKDREMIPKRHHDMLAPQAPNQKGGRKNDAWYCDKQHLSAREFGGIQVRHIQSAEDMPIVDRTEEKEPNPGRPVSEISWELPCRPKHQQNGKGKQSKIDRRRMQPSSLGSFGASVCSGGIKLHALFCEGGRTTRQSQAAHKVRSWDPHKRPAIDLAIGREGNAF